MTRVDAEKILLGKGFDLTGCAIDGPSGCYATWEPGDKTAVLDGSFDADSLEAIAVWIRTAPVEVE